MAQDVQRAGGDQDRAAAVLCEVCFLERFREQPADRIEGGMVDATRAMNDV
jgi:hypothetical protein